jgi:hypothetical protein
LAIIQEGYFMKMGIVIGFTVLLTACGKDPSTALQTALSNHLGNEPLASTQASEELLQVTQEIHLAIGRALVPGFQTRAVSTSGCKPAVTVALTGVTLTFSANPTCTLSGTVVLSAFPMKATANLEVVGLSIVKKLVFVANVNLAKGLEGTSLNLVYQDARFSLASLKFLGLQDVLSSGIVSLSISSGRLGIDSRLNAFDEKSGLGVAILGKTEPSTGTRNIQSCLLSNGSGSDPRGGTIGACFKLGSGV